MVVPSETIQVALITLASGAIGAAAGTFGVIWSSSRAAKAQMQKTAVEEFFKTRIEAYRKVLDLRIEMELVPALKDPMEAHKIRKAFSLAVDNAILVSSPETAAILVLLRDVQFDAANSAARSQIFTDALIAMGEELASFKTPRLTPNRWTKRRRNAQLQKAVASLSMPSGTPAQPGQEQR